MSECIAVTHIAQDIKGDPQRPLYFPPMFLGECPVRNRMGRDPLAHLGLFQHLSLAWLLCFISGGALDLEPWRLGEAGGFQHSGSYPMVFQ